MLITECADGRRQFRNIEVCDDGKEPHIFDLTLNGAEFFECSFHSCEFYKVSLVDAKFLDCSLKCVTFDTCDLRNSYWDGCAVCSVEIKKSLTDGLDVKIVDAYGCRIEGAAEFLEYAFRPKAGESK